MFRLFPLVGIIEVKPPKKTKFHSYGTKYLIELYNVEIIYDYIFLQIRVLKKDYAKL